MWPIRLDISVPFHALPVGPSPRPKWNRARGAACVIAACAALATTGTAWADTTASWLLGPGVWYDGTNWDIGTPPDNGSPPGTKYIAVIDSFGEVSLAGFGVDLNGLTIGADNSLTISGAGSPTSAAGGIVLHGLGGTVSLANSGTLTLDGTVGGAAILKFSGLGATTPLVGMLSGGGTVSMIGGSILPDVGSESLVNVDNLMQGSGTIGLNFTNHKKVDANFGAGKALSLSGTTNVNTDTMQASLGSILQLLKGSYDNTGGTIQAIGGSTVNFSAPGFPSSVTVIGGTLKTDATSVMINGGSLTLDGTAGLTISGAPGGPPGATGLVTVDSFTLYLKGTITNDSVIGLSALPDGPPFPPTHTAMVINTDVLLTGTGSVQLSPSGKNLILSADGTKRLTLDTGQTIQGAGNVGGGAMALTNKGTIAAIFPPPATMSPLTIAPNAAGVINTGTLEATGGTLVLSGGTFTNTDAGVDGLVFAGPGSTVKIDHATIEGGLVKTALGGTIDADSGPANEIHNATATNPGTIQASSGSVLALAGGTYANDGGTIQAVAGSFVAASEVQLYGGVTITKGSIGTVPGMIFSGVFHNLGFATLDGVTVFGGTVGMDDGTTTTLKGTITNNSVMELNGAGLGHFTDVVLNGNVVLDGAGVFQLSDNAGNRIIGAAGTEQLAIGANQTVRGIGQIGAGQLLSVVNNGNIIADGAAGSSLVVNLAAGGGTVNNAAAAMTAMNGAELILDGGFVTNAGSIAADATGGASSVRLRNSVVITGGKLDSVAGGMVKVDGPFSGATVPDATLNAVTINAPVFIDSTATLYLQGNVTNNNTISLDPILGADLQIIGSLTLDGTGSVVLQDGFFDVISAKNSLDTLTIGANQTVKGYGQLGNGAMGLINKGTIDANIGLVAGKVLTIDPNAAGFVNQGTVHVAGGATLTDIGGYQQTAGKTQVDGTMNLSGGTLTITGGTLIGSGGTINGDVQVSGTGAVGTGVFPLTINGTMTFGSGGAYNCVMAGGGGDKLFVNGLLDLSAGDTFLNLTNGGTVFPHLIGTFSSLSGVFTHVTSGYYVHYDKKNGQILVLFGAGGPPQWNVDGGGSWTVPGNWIGGIPDGVGATAGFLGALQTAANAPAVVTLDGSHTVGTIVFNNTTSNGADPRSYVIAQGSSGTLTFDNGGASPAQILVDAGTHGISAPLAFADNTNIVIAPGSDLQITGAASVAAGKTLTNQSAGTLELTGGLSLASGASLLLSSGPVTASNITGSGSITVGDGINPVLLQASSVAGSALTINAGSTARINTGAVGNTTSFGGVLAGTGNLTVTGSGTLSLTGTGNTFAGTANVNSGALQIGPGNLPAAAGVTLGGGTLRVLGNAVQGFGGAGAGWTLNAGGGNPAGVPSVAGDLLTLTTGHAGEVSSAFYNTPQDISKAFFVSFTYQDVLGGGSGDGTAFLVQNDPRGAAAVGTGGGFGFPGIVNGGGLTFNFNNTHKNDVTFYYDATGRLFRVHSLDETTADTIDDVFPDLSLADFVGGSSAYIGFTGATGDGNSQQQISNLVLGVGVATLGNNLHVAAAGSSLDVQNSNLASLGSLTFDAGGTLDVPHGGATFTATSFTGGTATLNNAGNVALGPLSAAAALNFTKTGAGDARLDTMSVSGLPAGSAINVNGGTFSVVTVSGSNPLGSASIGLGGGTLQVSSRDGHDLALDLPVAVSGNSGITALQTGSGQAGHGGAPVVSVGGSSAVTLGSGANLNLTVYDGYGLLLPKLVLTGDATINNDSSDSAIRVGNVSGGANTLTLTGANHLRIVGNITAGNIIVNNGGMDLDAASAPGSAIAINSALDVQTKLVAMSGTSVLQALTLDGAQAGVDLMGSSLVLKYSGASPYAAYEALIQSGAIYTSLNHPTPSESAVVALVDNSVLHLTTWHGVTISDGVDFRELLFAYTYPGDVNLDGTVTQADYYNVIANMGKTNATWTDGDMNGDGVVTPADLAIVTANLGAGTGGNGPPLAALAGPAPVTAVPEPGGLVLAMAAALALSRRRRRGAEPPLACRA
ncbi:MAG: dockerin type I domain-containing protein [Tepidisphaerales bacterium]